MLSQEQIEAALSSFSDLRHWRQAICTLDRIIPESGAGGDGPIVASAVALLDALYSAQLMHRPASVESLAAYEPRFWLLVERFQYEGPKLTERLGQLGIRDSNLGDLGDHDVDEIVQIHSELAGFDTPGEISFVSKYLHFRFPALFPMFDSVVREWVNRHGGGANIKGQCYKDLVDWYKWSLSEKWTTPVIEAATKQSPAPFGLTEVRLLDAVVWLAGQASRFQRKRVTQSVSVNKEVFIFFRENPETARLLSQ